MKKSILLSLSVLLVLQIGFSKTISAEEIKPEDVYKALKNGDIEIKSKNPNITNNILIQDMKFIENNWQKTKLAKKFIPSYMILNSTVDAWVDIRTKGYISAIEPLRSVDSFDRYGILRVNSTPKTGATVILNEKETWDETTNTYKGVRSGNHTVGVELEGYEADPKNVSVPEGGDVSVTIELKEKEK
jgi:hypothetical protein